MPVDPASGIQQLKRMHLHQVQSSQVTQERALITVQLTNAAVRSEEAAVRFWNWKAFFSGVCLSTFGVALAGAAATNNEASPAGFMEIGHSSLAIGVLFALTGALITFRALAPELPIIHECSSAWKRLIYIIGGNFAFGLLLCGAPGVGIPPMGILVAVFVVVFIVRLSDDSIGFSKLGLLAIVIAAGSYLAFLVVLKAQLPVWPTFLLA
jgi:hypothetical protein